MSTAHGFISSSVELYRKTLLRDVIPFWLRHAIDPDSGAINNCIDDEGNLLSTDKYLWSQGRALWTFSALCNRVERRSEWLSVADGLFHFLRQNGRADNGRWMYRLDADGDVLDGDISIYVDGFVMNGLGEYYLATGDPRASELAVETYTNVKSRLRSQNSYGLAPFSAPENTKSLGVPMIFAFFFNNLGKALDRADMRQAAYELAKEVLRDFYLPGSGVLVELASSNGGAMPAEHRYCVPGHAIEACWFLMSIFEETGDTDLVKRCCDLVIRHIELGWDDEWGGIRLAVDLDAEEPVRDLDLKPWWVQVEGLVATAYAFSHTGSDVFLHWHRELQEYAFSRYPVPTGEWTQWLDRYGNKTESVSLPVKDPFHLPRGLIYLLELFENRISIEAVR